MSSRGGLVALSKDNQHISAKKPVYTKIVKESLKSIILSGESELDIFVSHHFLYLYGFLTGWSTRFITLELLPILYFSAWAVALLILGYHGYALMYFITAIIVILYFILLHSVISSWDRIRHWFIRRARKRGGVNKMTLEDIKFLLIFTRNVFGVKPSIQQTQEKPVDLDFLRKMLVRNRRWQYALNATILLSLVIITGGTVIAFALGMNFIAFISDWWYVVLILLNPIAIVLIGLFNSKFIIKDLINAIPLEKLDDVLRVLNEFELFGIKGKQ